MASLASTGNYHFHSKITTQRIRQVAENKAPRSLVIVSCCRGREPTDDNNGSKSNSELRRTKNEENERKEKEKEVSFGTSLFSRFEKIGESVKESLSPKQKGDWKDLTLMSLSFAVYVYISQRIVCAYFIWMSMPRQQW